MMNASDTAYLTLRTLINSGKLAPGERITEEDGSRICNVSRTPVRDALRRMENEMLLHRERGGLVVSKWTKEDVASIFEIRRSMESQACKNAANKASEDEIRELRELHERMGEIAKSDAERLASEFHELNYRFHRRIGEIGMGDQFRLIEKTIDDAVLFRSATNLTKSAATDAWQEHDMILRALTVRDPKAASDAMSLHIRLSVYTHQRLFEDAKQ